MTHAGSRVRHLSEEEIVGRVFPASEGVPVPLHLAVCSECQARVALLREAWLLDRGAVEGTVDAVPDAAWREQTAAVMSTVREEAVRPRTVMNFVLRWPTHLVRRPVLAVLSVAAAVVLVAGLTLLRPGSVPVPQNAAVSPAAATASSLSSADASDDELLREVDRLVSSDLPLSDLVPTDGA